MNIFIIPSWYPSRRNPLSGVFFREQAQAVAELDDSHRIIVSTWGHEDGYVPFRDLSRSLGALSWRAGQRSGQTSHSDRFVELRTPALSWSRRLPLGGTRSLIKANRANLRAALQAFGDIDVIHAQVSYPAGHIASELSRASGIPYVLSEHMSPFPVDVFMQDGHPIPEIEQAFARAALNTAVSPSLAERIASFGLGHPVVVPNFVDEDRFVPGEPKGRKFTFLTLGGLSPQKGIPDLLRAIARWNPHPGKTVFRIGGDGPEALNYRQMAHDLGIADRVEWLGFVPRNVAPGLFRDCHAYVMPSLHETFGIVYAEALASGKPVIATRCGGPEFIVNEQNGYLIDIGDIEALAAAMERLVASWGTFNPADIRNDFMARFSRRAVVGQLIDIYRSVAGSN